MYIQQVDLTRGVESRFVDKLRNISHKEKYRSGDILFRKGDAAQYVYLLLMGKVHLKMGEIGHVIHVVNKPGETFGWSSLAQMKYYTLTAECMDDTYLRKMNIDDFKKLLKDDPNNGLIFFQRLAGMLGERLIESYSRYEKLFKGETYV